MSDDPRFPKLESFPPEGGSMPSTTMEAVVEGYGIVTSQDGDHLHSIDLSIALGPTPQEGFVSVTTDAEGAREIAAHLLHLAKYAELGVEAEPYE